MSRISCNVTKDLLPAYLDGVCSGESGELVEEHLAECPACRRFLEGLKQPDAGQDEFKVAYLKKVRRFMNIQSLVGIFLPLAILLAGFYGINHNSSGPLIFYYVEMPVMMMLCAYFLGSGKSKAMPVGKEWLIPVWGVVLVSLAAVMWYFLSYRIVVWAEEEAAAPIPLGEVGPILHGISLAVALGAAALLIVLVILAKKEGRFLLVSGGLAWLAINMVLTMDEAMYHMSEWEALQKHMAGNGAILVTEFAVVTGILALLRRKGLMNPLTQSTKRR